MSDTTYVSQLHANDDAKFFSDVYIYGNLYYDLDGTDNLKLDNITVNHQANFKDIFATGIGTFNGPITFNSGVLFAGIVTFTEPIDVDYLHVKKRLWVGVNDNYNKTFSLAQMDYYNWVAKDYDDVVLTEIQKDGTEKIIYQVEIENEIQQ